jgi:hypothetical protein
MSDIYAIITSDRMTGYANVPYSSDSEEETVVETTEEELTGIFETAKSNGGTLDGTDETIDAAIDDPLTFHDYLILDSNGALTFDDGYTRETADGTTSS